MKKWKLKLMKEAAKKLPVTTNVNGQTVDNFRRVKKFFKVSENKKELNKFLAG